METPKSPNRTPRKPRHRRQNSTSTDQCTNHSSPFPITPTRSGSKSSTDGNNNNNIGFLPASVSVSVSSSPSANTCDSASKYALLFSSPSKSIDHNAESYIPPGILNSPVPVTVNVHSPSQNRLEANPFCGPPSPASPSKPRYGDRFIPTRAGNTWHLTYPTSPTPHTFERVRPPTPPKKSKEIRQGNKEGSSLYSALLMNEVLGYQHEDKKELSGSRKATPNRKLFNFDSTDRSAARSAPSSPYSLSPISHKSDKLLRSPTKPTRRISKAPYKVLDAPELQDDFYLNLVDWSKQNVLSVGLGTCVFLWSAVTSQVTRLCDLALSGNSVTSVGWNQTGNLLAVGTQAGVIQVWDPVAEKQVSAFRGHTARAGAIAWNRDLLSSGSRDRSIYLKDIREAPSINGRQLIGHRQEVCGLKWSPDNQCLASGGNDNKLCLWNLHCTSPVHEYTEHLAAVKAIAWSPHHHGLLASGGGTVDRCIKFWNTLTSQPLQSVDTGSQVCNLAWAKHSSEFVSTHGYSQNEIILWKYPSLQQVAKLNGHRKRTLFLAMSPDGQSIVTGSGEGDETLRFWNLFPSRPEVVSRSSLSLYNNIR